MRNEFDGELRGEWGGMCCKSWWVGRERIWVWLPKLRCKGMKGKEKVSKVRGSLWRG